jgi:molybdopterin molybdotransferase
MTAFSDAMLDHPPQTVGDARSSHVLPATIGEARDFIAATYRRVSGTELLPAADALGRILAEDVRAICDLPRFDAAAVDGYALRAADLAGGRVEFRVIGRAAAGHPAKTMVAPGEAMRIFTGAVVPAGADRVVMQEDTSREGDALYHLPKAIGRSNIRKRGEDVAAGSLLLARGARIDAAALGLLAAQQIPALPVCARLKVALFSTGDELRAPGEGIPAGAIADANRPLLGALLAALGCSIEDGGILRDDPAQQTARLIAAAARNDLIVTSGGASVGEEDHLTRVIRSRGSLEIRWLKIKPGKPVCLGDIDDCPILALPGNPVAAALTFLTLGWPLVARLAGARDLAPRSLRLPVAVPLEKRPRRWEAIPAAFAQAPDGATAVAPCAKTGAAMLSGLAAADGFILLPEAVEHVPAGALVDFMLLPRG